MLKWNKNLEGKNNVVKKFHNVLSQKFCKVPIFPSCILTTHGLTNHTRHICGQSYNFCCRTLLC